MWKNSNFFILILQLLLLAIGLYFNLLTFGHGLGDIVFFIIMVLMLIIHIILTFFWRDEENKLKLNSIIFGMFLVFIFLKATIFRGAEYPWNGRIFYESF